MGTAGPQGTDCSSRLQTWPRLCLLLPQPRPQPRPGVTPSSALCAASWGQDLPPCLLPANLCKMNHLKLLLFGKRLLNILSAYLFYNLGTTLGIMGVMWGSAQAGEQCLRARWPSPESGQQGPHCLANCPGPAPQPLPPAFDIAPLP